MDNDRDIQKENGMKGSQDNMEKDLFFSMDENDKTDEQLVDHALTDEMEAIFDEMKSESEHESDSASSKPEVIEDEMPSPTEVRDFVSEFSANETGADTEEEDFSYQSIDDDVVLNLPIIPFEYKLYFLFIKHGKEIYKTRNTCY